jgi:hypothetical protein
MIRQIAGRHVSTLFCLTLGVIMSKRSMDHGDETPKVTNASGLDETLIL